LKGWAEGGESERDSIVVSNWIDLQTIKGTILSLLLRHLIPLSNSCQLLKNFIQRSTTLKTDRLRVI
jgi:hypothetical protein